MDSITASRPEELSSERYEELYTAASEREALSGDCLPQDRILELENIKKYTCPFRILLPVNNKAKRKTYRVTPCGKCFYCKLREEAAFATRIINHLSSFPRRYFITITQNPDDYDIQPVKQTRKILRALEYRLGSFYYYGIREYGPNTFRAHTHIITGFSAEVTKDILMETLTQIVPLTIIKVDPVTDGSIRYCASYCKKLFSSTPIARFYKKKRYTCDSLEEYKEYSNQQKLGYLEEVYPDTLDGYPLTISPDIETDTPHYKLQPTAYFLAPTKEEFRQYKKRLFEAYQNYLRKKID